MLLHILHFSLALKVFIISRNSYFAVCRNSCVLGTNMKTVGNNLQLPVSNREFEV